MLNIFSFVTQLLNQKKLIVFMLDYSYLSRWTNKLTSDDQISKNCWYHLEENTLIYVLLKISVDTYCQ